MSVFVTGAAGFIGYHTCRHLLERGETVIGIDIVNEYYDPTLKRARLERLNDLQFSLVEIDISDRDAVLSLIDANPDIDCIIHLAAQAGVRYSLIDPYAYTRSNVEGQLVMLEAARKLKSLKHFVYASSSSVYGANTKQPFSIEDRVDSPVSLYAATKRAGELITECYNHLYDIPATGVRFFTVYGTWGRPDMAYWTFTRKILAGEPIEVFNNGDMRRDFTYIDDIIAGLIAIVDSPSPTTHPARVYNLGNNQSEKLTDFIATLEDALGRKAEMILKPMQMGDVKETYADIEATRRDFGFEPKTTIAEGIPMFIDWYKEYHQIN